MKITKVDVMQVNDPGVHMGWRPVICRIYTDEGIYGDGEAALAYGVAAPAAFGMVQDLAKLIIGMDPLKNEVIWDKLYKETFWGQNGGPVVFAGISALDIALWDIKGKYFNVPLHVLLGGKKRDKLRCYASQLMLGWQDGYEQQTTTEGFVNASKKAVSEGYDAVKIDFFILDKDGTPFTTEDRNGLLKPYYIDLLEERVAAVREGIGPGVDIIIENHSLLDANSAVQFGRRAEKYNIFYFEEPNTPTPKMTKYICDKINIPIASGERIYSRWQYAQYYENSSLQIIQPDLGNCGGLTEGKKICDMAYVYDVGVQAHVCASPLSTAVSLHLEAVIPNFVIHEHHVVNLAEYNKKLCIHDYQPVNGEYSIPDLPGIGNEFSEYALTNNVKVTVE